MLYNVIFRAVGRIPWFHFTHTCTGRYNLREIFNLVLDSLGEKADFKFLYVDVGTSVIRANVKSLDPAPCLALELEFTANACSSSGWSNYSHTIECEVSFLKFYLRETEHGASKHGNKSERDPTEE